MALWRFGRGWSEVIEMRAAGFHFVNGCRIQGVDEGSDGTGSHFSFRFDTLRGHVERGVEWFLIRKEHASGEVSSTTEAHWQLGNFPNRWIKAGFELIGRHYRTLWRRRAASRLRDLAHQAHARPIAPPDGLAHRGDRPPGARDARHPGWPAVIRDPALIDPE